MNPDEGQDSFRYRGSVQPPAGEAIPSANGVVADNFVAEQNVTAPVPEHSQPVHSDVKPVQNDDTSLVQWQASEFVDHQKNPTWYVLLALAALLLCGLMYLFTRSILSAVVTAMAILAFGMVANQRPRTLTYALGSTSLRVGSKSYLYDDFRSFSIVRDGALWSMVLQPNKRFMPVLTIYFAPDDGEKIFDALATHLPHEERNLDSVDRLMRKIRF